MSGHTLTFARAVVARAVVGASNGGGGERISSTTLSCSYLDTDGELFLTIAKLFGLFRGMRCLEIRKYCLNSSTGMQYRFTFISS